MDELGLLKSSKDLHHPFFISQVTHSKLELTSFMHQEPSRTANTHTKSMYLLLQNYPDVQAGFRKGRGTRHQIANIRWMHAFSQITAARQPQRGAWGSGVLLLTGETAAQSWPHDAPGRHAQPAAAHWPPTGNLIWKSKGSQQSSTFHSRPAGSMWELRVS